MGENISSWKFSLACGCYHNLVVFEAYGKPPEMACFSDHIFSMPMVYILRSLERMSVNIDQGPVPQKPINANLRLKINQAVYFSTPKCCSTQIFGRTLHEKTSILKNKNKQKKLSPKS